jgi:hypothetical protein
LNEPAFEHAPASVAQARQMMPSRNVENLDRQQIQTWDIEKRRNGKKLPVYFRCSAAFELLQLKHKKTQVALLCLFRT